MDMWGVSAASAAPIWQDTIASNSSQNSADAADKLRTLLRRAEWRATTMTHTSRKASRLWARHLDEKDNIVWPRFIRPKLTQAYITHFELDNDLQVTQVPTTHERVPQRKSIYVLHCDARRREGTLLRTLKPNQLTIADEFPHPMREVLTEYVKNKRVSAFPCAPVHVQDGPKRSDERKKHLDKPIIT